MPRGQLSEDGFIGMMASDLALIELKRLEFGIKESIDALEQLFDAYSGVPDTEKALWGIFVRSQNGLMAFRRDDFLTIQSETPFNDHAVIELNRYFAFWREGGTGRLRREYELSRAMLISGMKDFTPQPPIRILGGDGSKNDPIMLTAPNLKKRVRAESWYMNYEFGSFEIDWNETSHMTTPSDDGRMLSLWNIELGNGTDRRVYFDTGLYGH